MIGDGFTRVLERAREGDEIAWTALYDDLSGPLLGYLRGRGAPEPEDQLGETFLQVARDLPRFDGDETGFRSWVFTAQFVTVGVPTLQVQAVGTDGFVRAVSLGIEVTEDTVRSGLLGTDGGIVGVLATLPPAVLALIAAVVLVLVAPTVRRRRVGGSDAT